MPQLGMIGLSLLPDSRIESESYRNSRQLRSQVVMPEV